MITHLRFCRFCFKLMAFSSLIIVLLLSVLNLSSFADISHEQAQRLDQLAWSQHWLNLLQYKKSFWGSLKSRSSKDSGFFFSPNGFKDPRAELLATIEAFNSNQQLPTQGLPEEPITPASCAFPARFEFLTKHGFEFPHPQCKIFEKWLKLLAPQSVSLVYSSAYPGSPGSMLGHSFLRIHKDSVHDEPSSDFLDTGISFAAAIPPDENSFAYFWFGVTGGYQGTFSVLPYYVKIQEYVNSENRDLWEYPVGFSKQETIFFLKYIWELQFRAHFKYYFFDENCSFILLAALQAIRPDWNLTDLGLFVIPGETIKKAVALHAVQENPYYRPSQRHLVEFLYAQLNSDQRKQFWEYLKSTPTPSGLTFEPMSHTLMSPGKDPRALDAALQYLLYKKQKDSLTDKTEIQLQKQLLLLRASMPATPVRLIVPESPVSTRPNSSHHPKRIDFSYGRNIKLGDFASFRLKLSYHDLMDDDQGYNRFSQIDFPNINLRFNQNKLLLQELPLVEVTSINSQNSIFTGMSYKVQTGFYRPKHQDYNQALTYILQAGPGLAYEFFTPNTVLYSFLLIGMDALPQKPIRLGPRFMLGIISEPLSKYKLSLQWTGKWQPFLRTGLHFVPSIEAYQSLSLSPSLAVRLYHHISEHELAILFYF